MGMAKTKKQKKRLLVASWPLLNMTITKKQKKAPGRKLVIAEHGTKKKASGRKLVIAEHGNNKKQKKRLLVASWSLLNMKKRASGRKLVIAEHGTHTQKGFWSQ